MQQLIYILQLIQLVKSFFGCKQDVEISIILPLFWLIVCVHCAGPVPCFSQYHLRFLSLCKVGGGKEAMVYMVWPYFCNLKIFLFFAFCFYNFLFHLFKVIIFEIQYMHYACMQNCKYLSDFVMHDLQF